MLFSKPVWDIEDVISLLVREDDDSDDLEVQWKVLGFDDNGNPVGVLPDVLRELDQSKKRLVLKNAQAGTEEELDFTEAFFKHVTASRSVPINDPTFRITVEFDRYGIFEHKDAIPMAFTCPKSLVLPSTAYGGDKEVLKEKLLYSILEGCSFFTGDATHATDERHKA